MRVAIACLLALSLPLGVAACDKEKAELPQGEPQAAGAIDRSQAGTPAPDVTFEDPQGQPTSLAAFRGRPLLVNLWATWCAPCIVEMPSLDALAQREGDALQVLALSQDMDGRDKVTEFFRERGFQALEPYLDPDLELMTELGISTLPTTILYDAQGREVWRKAGIEDWQSEDAARLIAEAEAG